MNKPVEMVVIGYEWTCPECNERWEETHRYKEVVCPECNITFIVEKTHHI